MLEIGASNERQTENSIPKALWRQRQPKNQSDFGALLAFGGIKIVQIQKTSSMEIYANAPCRPMLLVKERTRGVIFLRHFILLVANAVNEVVMPLIIKSLEKG